jgi:hypothetical protein
VTCQMLTVTSVPSCNLLKIATRSTRGYKHTYKRLTYKNSKLPPLRIALQTRSPRLTNSRYETLLGCGNIDLTNTTDHYARFTISNICNAIVQLSIEECNLTPENSRPLCAETCVRWTLPQLRKLLFFD